MDIITQVNLTTPNAPNTLARISDALRGVGVNIEAISCRESLPNSIVHLIVNDPETATPILRKFGQVDITPVFAFRMKNVTGALGNVTRALGSADINIRNMYASSSESRKVTSVYVSVDDIEKATATLNAWKQRGHKL